MMNKWVWAMLAGSAVYFAGVTAAPAQDLPEKAPGLRGLGDEKSVGVFAPIGALTEALKLEVPPGRKGVEPKLSLLYNSATQNRDAGLGWAFELGKIEKGVRFDFVASIGGTNANLVLVSPGVYRADSESVYRQFSHITDHWEMADAAGTRFIFGSSPSARVDDAVWMLERIEDTNGNYMTASYLEDGGWFYPDTIAYTGHVGTGLVPGNQLQFSYATRIDPRVDYLLGFRREHGLLPTSVLMRANGSVARSYEFAYDAVGGRSVLKQVNLVGASGTRVSARKYEYASVAPGWPGPQISGTLPVALNNTDGTDTGARLVDVNGDNFVDEIDNSANVWLGDGSGHFTPNAAWSASLAATGLSFVDGDHRDLGVRLVDVDGDMRPDLLKARNGSPNKVWLNNGNGWTSSAAFSSSLDGLEQSQTTTQRFLGVPCNEPADPNPNPMLPGCDDSVGIQVKLSVVESDGDSAGAFLADVNGDGLADILWNYKSTDALFNSTPTGGTSRLGRTPVFIQAVYLNTGTGWAIDSALTNAISAVPPFVIDSKPQGFDVFDINGDGLADLIDTSDSAANRAAFLGTGSDWILDSAYSASLQGAPLVSISGDKGQGLVPLDYDGDGLMDMLRSDESVTVAFHNTGLGFSEDPAFEAELVAQGITFVDGDGKSTGFSFSDFNGDNRPDLVQAQTGSPSDITMAGVGANGLMTKAVTAYGEETDVSYLQSSVFSNASGGVQGLPTVLYVVDQLTRHNGAQQFTKQYSYEGGRFADQKMLGFASVVSVDNRNVATEFTNRQDSPFELRPSSVVIRDAAGQMRHRTSTTYAAQQPLSSVPKVKQVLTVQTDEETFDAGVAAIHTRMRFGYDLFLNQTQILNDGDITTTADDTRSVLEFAQNPATSVLSSLSRVTVFNPDGTIASQNGLLYDGLAFGSVSKGNATQLFQVVDPARTTTVTLTYDAFGNVLSMKDATGNTSTSAYDAQGIYRIQSSNALGLSIGQTFDARFGVSLQTTDAGGNVTTRTFDEFGRPTRETRPGDTASPFGTRSFEYGPLGSSQYIRVRSTEVAGQSGTFDTWLYFDAFLQANRLEQEALNGRATVIVRQWDDAGTLLSQSMPHFSGDAAPLSTFQYDALRRLVQQTDPEGTFVTRVYKGFDTDETDRRGNHSVTTHDAYNRITRIAQQLGAVQQVTSYRFDTLGNTTQVVDARGNTTRLTYNLAGWRTRLDDPTRGVATFSFDNNGRITSEINALNQSTSYQYDAAGNMTRKALGTGEVFTYQFGTSGNGAGRLVHTGELAGSTDYTYDARANVTVRKHTVNGTVYLSRYTFDSLDRAINLRYPDGFFVNYSYGTNGRVDHVTDDKGRLIVSGVQYNPFGAIASMNFANGVASLKTFDTEGKLREINDASPKQGTFWHETYSYDSGKNIARISDLLDARLTQVFQYDALNRLTNAQTDRNASYGNENYTYDAVGNLQSKADLLFRYRGTNPNLPSCVIDRTLAAQSANIPPGSANDPCVVGPTEDPYARRGTGESVHQSQAFRLSYNAEGNLTQKNLRHYRYDAESRLVEVSENSQIWMTNYFDALGNRVRRFSQQADTTYIDGIYETEQSQTRRIIKIDDSIVSTFASPGRALLESEVIGYWQSRPVVQQRHWLIGFGLAFCLALCSLLAWALNPKRRVQRVWARMAFEELYCGVGAALRSGKLRWALAIGLSVSQVSLYAPNAQAVTRTANYTDDQRFYYHLDHMGGTKFITNFEGMVHARRYYTPFGEQLYPPGMDGSLQNNYSFDGKELDRAQIPELYHFGARAYDPTFGRFLSTDTVVKQPFNPASLNRLAFAANNPLRFADPSGHSFLDVLAGVLIVVAVVAAAAVISIATLGAGAPISAILIGATIGAVVAGGVAVGLAAAGKIDSFWEGAGFALAGAVIGASAVGAYLAAAAAGASTGWTAFAYNVLGGALAGGASGGLSGMAQAAYNERFDLMLTAFLYGYSIGAALGAVSGAVGGGTAKALGFDTTLSPVASGGGGLGLPAFFTTVGSLGGGIVAGALGSVNLNAKLLGLNAPSFLLVTTDPEKVDSRRNAGPPSPIR